MGFVSWALWICKFPSSTPSLLLLAATPFCIRTTVGSRSEVFKGQVCHLYTHLAEIWPLLVEYNPEKTIFWRADKILVLNLRPCMEKEWIFLTAWFSAFQLPGQERHAVSNISYACAAERSSGLNRWLVSTIRVLWNDQNSHRCSGGRRK